MATTAHLGRNTTVVQQLVAVVSCVTTITSVSTTLTATPRWKTPGHRTRGMIVAQEAAVVVGAVAVAVVTVYPEMKQYTYRL
jgi:hypothetical protein